MRDCVLDFPIGQVVAAGTRPAVSQKAERPEMEISGPRRIDAARLARAKGVSGANGKSFTTGDAAETHTAGALTGGGPIAAVDTIFALQGIEDWDGGNARAARNGEQLLVLLDEVRDGLLAGGIPRMTLTRLAAATARRHDSFADAKLQTILDEIDLRARVELAKLEQVDRHSQDAA